MTEEILRKRDEAMNRFMAAKERKRKRMEELEQMLKKEFYMRNGEEPKYVNVW